MERIPVSHERVSFLVSACLLKSPLNSCSCLSYLTVDVTVGRSLDLWQAVTLSVTFNVPRAFGVTINMPGLWATLLLLGGTIDVTVLINVLDLILSKEFL